MRRNRTGDQLQDNPAARASVLAQQCTIGTIAGDGVARTFLNNPTIVAVDAAGDVYVGDWSGLIRKIWVRDGAVITVAGTGTPGYGGDGPSEHRDGYGSSGQSHFRN